MVYFLASAACAFSAGTSFGRPGVGALIAASIVAFGVFAGRYGNPALPRR